MTDTASLGRHITPHSAAHHRPSQAEISRVTFLLSTAAYAPATVAASTAAATRYHAYCPHPGHHVDPLHFDPCVREYICALLL